MIPNLVRSNCVANSEPHRDPALMSSSDIQGAMRWLTSSNRTLRALATRFERFPDQLINTFIILASATGCSGLLAWRETDSRSPPVSENRPFPYTSGTPARLSREVRPRAATRTGLNAVGLPTRSASLSTSRSLVHLWSRPIGIAEIHAKYLISLARPTGIEPVFPP